MREIKFRAWDKDYKYMNHKVMVGNVWDEENYHAHMIWVDRKDVDYECESGWMNFDEHSNIEIMQYTGLKDKNGVEIYEGDIFWSDHSGEYTYVEYQEGAFYIIHTVTSEKTLLSKEHGDWIIRGNIYENPELLEGLK